MARRGMRVTKQALIGVLGLSFVYTLLNILKPIHIDDTAFYLYASHIVRHPLDPYGFQIYWFNAPQPAIIGPTPPFFIYYFASLIGLFGESPMLWKLGCMPLNFLFFCSIYIILKRFVPKTLWIAMGVFALSPAVLPAANLMLDVPYISLYLAALALFLFGIDRTSVPLILLAGLLAGLSMQTKYNAISILPVAVVASLLNKKVRLGLIFLVVALAVAIGIEVALVLASGQSPFLILIPMKNNSKLLENAIGSVGQFGGVGFVLLIVMAFAFKIPFRFVVAYILLWVGLFFAGSFATPGVSFILHRVLFFMTGATALGGVCYGLYCTIGSHFRLTDLLHLKFQKEYLPVFFIASWAVAEFVVALVVSPFPAMRRIILFSFAVLIFVFMLYEIRFPKGISFRKGMLVLVVEVLFSGFIFFLDIQYARSQRDLAYWGKSAAVSHGLGQSGTVWYLGSWGFKFYADRAGMIPLVPGLTPVRAGDYIVYPEEGVSRPPVVFESDRFARIAALEGNLPFGLSPKYLYSGKIPLRKMSPVIKVVVYRCERDGLLPLRQ
jgi:hypothetical protein